MQFGKVKPFLGKICTRYERFMGINQLHLVGWSTVVLQKYPFYEFCSISVPKLPRFTRFSSGKVWFNGFAPCKRIDILQLWIFDMITQFNIFLLNKYRICPRNSNQSGWHRLNLWQTVSFVSFIRGNPWKFYQTCLWILFDFSTRDLTWVKLSNPVLDL